MMKNLDRGETKRMLIVVVVLILLLVSVALIRRQKEISLKQAEQKISDINITLPSPTPVQFETPGVYSINFPGDTLKVGEITTAEVNFYAEGRKVDGSDVILKYNPQVLEAAGDVEIGDYFTNYPIRSVDNVKGLVKVSAYLPKVRESMTAPELMFRISFKAISPGSADISFDFERYRTDRTTLVESITSRNILGTASPFVLQVNSGI